MEALTNNERLEEGRLDTLRLRPDHGVVNWNFSPSEDCQSFFDENRLNCRLNRQSLCRVRWKEGESGCIVAFWWKVEGNNGSEELVGYLQKDAGAVAGIDL
ncbi:unannotated protein [freshwater metagenome]|uniref:Unannotated protein n=1 Tax=freshwater metagenome TaxID=449393 RepID=A0A6J7VHA6_9ZZZZ